MRLLWFSLEANINLPDLTAQAGWTLLTVHQGQLQHI